MLPLPSSVRACLVGSLIAVIAGCDGNTYHAPRGATSHVNQTYKVIFLDASLSGKYADVPDDVLSLISKDARCALPAGLSVQNLSVEARHADVEWTLETTPFPEFRSPGRKRTFETIKGKGISLTIRIDVQISENATATEHEIHVMLPGLAAVAEGSGTLPFSPDYPTPKGAEVSVVQQKGTFFLAGKVRVATIAVYPSTGAYWTFRAKQTLLGILAAVVCLAILGIGSYLRKGARLE